jgi:uncharacterized membrane protein (TIGR02234 family)
VTGPDTAPRPAARAHRRGIAALLVLAGAGGTAGSAILPWWRRDYHDPLSGSLTVTVDGAALAPGLVPLALVAIAGLAAAMISRGLLRRLLGAVAGLAAAASAAIALAAATHTPDAEFASRLVRPAAPQSAPEMVWGAVILAVVAAVVGVAGGGMVAAAGDRRPGSGRAASLAYRPPAAQREAARNAAQHPATGAPAPPDGAAPQVTGEATAEPPNAVAGPADSGDWWRSLDAGVDPTDDARGR